MAKEIQTYEIGQLWNDINGTTASQKFQEHLRDTNISSALKQYAENGINPLLAVEGGAQMPGTSAVATAGAGAPHITGGIANIINSASKLLNANDNTENNKVQNFVYDQAGKLVSTAVKEYKTKYKL